MLALALIESKCVFVFVEIKFRLRKSNDTTLMNLTDNRVIIRYLKNWVFRQDAMRFTYFLG